ncbi:MAG: CHAT domain-containing protein, partial [Saprospiraceae bacterium]|nr:CHAT domain-containing protein [Saprospiraceae bacterium]
MGDRISPKPVKQWIYIAYVGGDLNNPPGEAIHINNLWQEVENVSTLLIPNATTQTLIEHLSRHNQRYLFHFCGHAHPHGLAMADGIAHGVHLFKLLREFEIVFLNGCYTRDAIRHLMGLAEGYPANIKAAISTYAEVYDDMAVNFATQFYQQLIQGNKTFHESFNLARDVVLAPAAVDLAKHESHAFEWSKDRKEFMTRGQGGGDYQRDKKYYEIHFAVPEYKDERVKTESIIFDQIAGHLIAGVLDHIDADERIYQRKEIRRGVKNKCNSALNHLKQSVFPFFRELLEFWPHRNALNKPEFDKMENTHLVNFTAGLYEIAINTLCHVGLADLWDQILFGKIRLDQDARDILAQFLTDPNSASIGTLRVISDLLDEPFVTDFGHLVETIDESCWYLQNRDPLIDVYATVEHLTTLIGACSQTFEPYEFRSIRQITYRSLRHFRGLEPVAVE